jgi:hypothetical protein
MVTQLRKFEVVPLTEEHLDWFVNVAATRMLLDELNRPELLNPSTLRQLAIKGMDEGTAFVVTCLGAPVGALGGLLLPNLYNPSIKTLAELFWYVLPEYRNTRAGAMLFAAFDDKGEKCATESTLSILPNSAVNISTLNKRGFRLEELGLRKRYRM